MPKIFRAANVEEAVALATRLQREGRYDWFRGQVRDWEPLSSFQRKSQEPGARDAILVQVNRFMAWAEDQPALRHLTEAAHEDAAFAVLQHHGVPTPYIDFTTDPGVAGFFASDCTKPPEEPGNSVIYCLDTRDLVEFYARVNATAGDEFVASPLAIDVSNLWRLQAQRGCFMVVNHPWHRLYDMDRILFPWTGVPAFPPRDQIYPPHKSALEQTLEQYFFNEQAFEGRKFMLEQGSRIETIRIREDQPYRPEFFLAPPQPLPQWNNAALESWLSTREEHFDRTVGRHMPIRLRNDSAAPSGTEQVFHAITSALRWQQALRREAVEWKFMGLPEKVDSALFATAVRDAWNGMRNLPYDDEDIASAMAALLTLCSIPDCGSMFGQAQCQAFTSWIPDAMEIEFGYADGSSSRAWCSDAALLGAIDPAWKGALHDGGSALSTADALCRTYAPRLMFDLDSLARIFARQIIPAQLAMERSLVLFNPAQLDRLGLP